MPRPVIDYKKCDNCKVCVEVCPMGVYAVEKGKVVVKNPEKCVGCRSCEVQCHASAIKVIE
ncbi:MAG: 4Fe-4S binding protein [Candidatus Nanoarchaeia archaeon]|nr:4Fe-4S binding protein [Candidatus Haiyanarchaeum thermophilum]MCW1303274.1 4Fe-4S binding protein [Candidatus Haiyanarchaeum thermophilum]MCW1303995.1 4Fe-4S binding protein [Candidatus Haiyanarchaeum thermophilum]MCW1306433.1 4Fe-4S binding protein [Candidatus Haiyanarchaeum thermophilum]MCW1307269.1 4Fe-4S binding protein [Candidatus Haiyanarchaeum thermophilum]